MGMNIWNMRESINVEVFVQIGLAQTEFGISDFHQHCEMAGAPNSILFAPSGLRLHGDIRWDWAQELAVDSIMFGDVIAVGRKVLLYMPNLAEKHGPERAMVPKRAISHDAIKWYLQCDHESDFPMETM